MRRMPGLRYVAGGVARPSASAASDRSPSPVSVLTSSLSLPPRMYPMTGGSAPRARVQRVRAHSHPLDLDHPALEPMGRQRAAAHLAPSARHGHRGPRQAPLELRRQERARDARAPRAPRAAWPARNLGPPHVPVRSTREASPRAPRASACRRGALSRRGRDAPDRPRAAAPGSDPPEWLPTACRRRK